MSLKVLAALAMAAFIGGALTIAAPQSANAKPEFAAATGKPCGACHANPAGGAASSLLPPCKTVAAFAGTSAQVPFPVGDASGSSATKMKTESAGCVGKSCGGTPPPHAADPWVFPEPEWPRCKDCALDRFSGNLWISLNGSDTPTNAMALTGIEITVWFAAGGAQSYYGSMNFPASTSDLLAILPADASYRSATLIIYYTAGPFDVAGPAQVVRVP